MTHASDLDPSTSTFSTESDETLDLRGTPCPINFVRTKLKLEKMETGKTLEVWLDPGEPIEQVPDSLRMEGYHIHQLEERSSFFVMYVQRPSVR